MTGALISFGHVLPRGLSVESGRIRSFAVRSRRLRRGVARDVDPDSFSKLTVLFDPRAELATLFFLFLFTFPFLQISVKDLLRVSPFRELVL